MTIISTRDPKSYTRNQASRLIAQTQDISTIEGFLTHGNKHVTRYAEHKLSALKNPPVSEGPASDRRLSLSEPEEVVVAALSETDAALNALAAEYGEDRGIVGQLFVDKGNLAAVKRSLISRKSARTRKAGGAK